MAEEERFELSRRTSRPTVFKTAAFNRSATPPWYGRSSMLPDFRAPGRRNWPSGARWPRDWAVPAIRARWLRGWAARHASRAARANAAAAHSRSGRPRGAVCRFLTLHLPSLRDSLISMAFRDTTLPQICVLPCPAPDIAARELTVLRRRPLSSAQPPHDGASDDRRHADAPNVP